MGRPPGLSNRHIPSPRRTGARGRSISSSRPRSSSCRPMVGDMTSRFLPSAAAWSHPSRRPGPHRSSRRTRRAGQVGARTRSSSSSRGAAQPRTVDGHGEVPQHLPGRVWRFVSPMGDSLRRAAARLPHFRPGIRRTHRSLLWGTTDASPTARRCPSRGSRIGSQHDNRAESSAEQGQRHLPALARPRGRTPMTRRDINERTAHGIIGTAQEDLSRRHHRRPLTRRMRSAP